MPLDQMAGDADRGASSSPEVLIPHSGRHESAVGEPGDTVVVAVLLQEDAALPSQDRRRAAQVEIVDFDSLALAVARGVEAKQPRRRLGQAQAMRIEGRKVQRPWAVGIAAGVVLQLEGCAMDELRMRACRRIDQIQVTRCAVTGRKQQTRGPYGQNIFRDDEVTYIGQSLLVATIGRRRACLRSGWRDVRILSDDR